MRDAQNARIEEHQEPNARILLIEPYEPIRKLVAVALEHAGHEVTAVADGDTAVEAMEREFFACVVVGSPVTVEVDGAPTMFLEYIERLCPEWRPCLIVITTYVESERVLSAAARLGVCAVFAKPFSPIEFLGVIDDCLAGRPPARRWFGIPEANVAAFVPDVKRERGAAE